MDSPTVPRVSLMLDISDMLQGYPLHQKPQAKKIAIRSPVIFHGHGEKKSTRMISCTR
mgnify:FL=1|jgi:hypothetical protein